MKVYNVEKFDGVTRVSIEHEEKVLSFELDLFDGACNIICEMDDPSGTIKYDEEFSLNMHITRENEAVFNAFRLLFINTEIMDIDCNSDKGLCTDISKLLSNGNKRFTWYSDNFDRSVANYFTVDDMDDYFLVGFHTQKPKLGIEKQQGSSVHIPVVVNNSNTVKNHSNYYPFNICLTTLYNRLKEIAPSNDKTLSFVPNKKTE